MVYGLGDVYLGAPCAVPLDPRQRLGRIDFQFYFGVTERFFTSAYILVVPKYNPARTFTPEGAVGIGGNEQTLTILLDIDIKLRSFHVYLSNGVPWRISIDW